MHASPYFDLKLFEPVATPPGPEIAEAYIDNYRNRIIKGRPSWCRLSSLRMTTYERSTLNDR